MGFINNTNGIELTVNLTPLGRKRLALGNSNLITSFGFGDSDTNYLYTNPLNIGEIPSTSGNKLTSPSNGGVNYTVRSVIDYKTNVPNKLVDINSIKVDTSVNKLPYETITLDASGNTTNVVSILPGEETTLSNLFQSFNLPIIGTEFAKYSTGIYKDTAPSFLAKKKVAIVGIGSDNYGEIMDGKSILIKLKGSLNIDIYGSYKNNSEPLINYDNKLRDNSQEGLRFGDNVVYLFSDDIQKPNNDSSLSWSTGYNTNKAFSTNNKQLFNNTTNSQTNKVHDKPIGLVYLDKGFIVFTDETIVSKFADSTIDLSTSTISFNHVNFKVQQQITCLANRGEFTTSKNKTWQPGDDVKITEVCLYDKSNSIIAIGKLNKPYAKNPNDLVVFTLKIEY